MNLGVCKKSILFRLALLLVDREAALLMTGRQSILDELLLDPEAIPLIALPSEALDMLTVQD